MKILVTGVNGLIGSRLAAVLRAAGCQVHGLGRGPVRTPQVTRYSEVELSDVEALRREVKRSGADVIVNTAALRDVDACEKHPTLALALNAHAVEVLAD